MRYPLLILLTITSLSVKADFKNFIKEGLKNSPNYAEVNEYDEFYNLSKKSTTLKLFLPELNLSHSFQKQETYSNISQNDFQTTSLNLNYSLFSFGSDYYSFKAADNKLNSFNNEKINALISEEEVLVNIYFDWVQNHKQLQTYSTLIELKEKLLKIATRKFQNGGISKNDFIRIKVDLADTKTTLISLKKKKVEILKNGESYKLSLKNITPDFPWTKGFQTQKLTLILNLKDQIDSNPLIKSIDQNLKSQEYETKSLFNSHFGELTFNFNRSRYQFDASDDVYAWSGSLNYNLPLYENFERQTRVASARAQVIILKKKLEYNKTSLKKYLERKKEQLSLTLENFLVFSTIEDDLDFLLKNLQNRFKQGVISTNDLFVEQDRILQTKLQLIQAKYDIHTEYINYLHFQGISLVNNSQYTF